MEFKAVNARMHVGETGIYVRARNEAGVCSAFDIAHLDRDSLHKWLRSRGGENLYAENVVLQLLGHQPITAVGEAKCNPRLARN
jgi:hypothetical protein